MNEEWTLFPLPEPKLAPTEKRFPPRLPIWSGCKAKLIERYLRYFVFITHHGNYIDGFAGPQRMANCDMWSARRVIEFRPRWLRKFFLFELDDAKVKKLHEMCGSQPPRDKSKGEPERQIQIFPGNFNENVHRMFDAFPIGPSEATFCLLDQRTFECDWKSVQAVAKAKGGNKIELFYFFPEGWLNRAVAALKYDKEERMAKWWGSDDWKNLTSISGVVRAKRVCERFRNEFDYKHVNAFPIYLNKHSGRLLYYMIHASDHDEAPGLMSRAYGKALDIPETPEQLDFLEGCQP